MKRVALALAAVWITGSAMNAGAAGFCAIGAAPAVVYDAPSFKANKLYILGSGYPLEIVTQLEAWTKVRDAEGTLSWVERKSLAEPERHTLMVKVALADVRTSADDGAPLAFQAAQNVLLDLIEFTGNGWAKVAHRDGQTGYVRLDQVWGA